MHIKLINPRMNSRPSDARLKFKLLPPQSLLLLGALTPQRHRLTVVDENVEEDHVHDDAPDLVAMPVYVATANRAYHLARIYRARGVRVVLGGLHVTCCPDEALRHADAVVVGEADRVWPRLLADLERGELAAVYRDDEPPPLSVVPVLRRDLVSSRRYASVAALRTGRGCPHRCDFCYQAAFYQRPGLRHRPVEQVLEEVRSLASRHVLFLDDNLIGSRKRARLLFRALRPLGVTWSGATTASIGHDPELLRLAWESGCRSLFIGFESLSQVSLDGHGKQQNRVEGYAAAIDAIHDQGIMVNGSFVFGLDDDGPDVFERTVEWIISNRVETATFHILTPYPGTPLFQRLEAQGRIIDRDWDHYNTAHAVFQPARMSPAELERGYNWAYREVYSWRNVIRRAPTKPELRLPYWGFVLGYKKLVRVTNALSRLGLMESLFSLFSNVLLRRGAGAAVSNDGAAELTAGRTLAEEDPPRSVDREVRAA